jgi:enoyl-[acyl-carrier protein] reductase II
MMGKVKWLAYLGADVPRFKTATVEGDYQKDVQHIGQTQGPINDQPSVQQLFETTLQDVQAVHDSNTRRLDHSVKEV